MSLNANDVPMSGGKKNPLIEVGGYPGRVVQVIDLGLQPQEYQGEEKPPAREIMLGYELSDEFLKDDEGNDIEDKPRWLSERMPLHNLKKEKAKSTLRYAAIDPSGKHKGEFTDLIGEPCIINVITKPGGGTNKGQEFNRVGSVSAIRAKEAEKLAPLVNTPILFLVDSPDKEVFDKLPDFIKTIIKGNLEYKGSKLEALLEGKVTPANTPDADDAEVDDDWRS